MKTAFRLAVWYARDGRTDRLDIVASKAYPGQFRVVHPGAKIRRERVCVGSTLTWGGARKADYEWQDMGVYTTSRFETVEAAKAWIAERCGPLVPTDEIQFETA